MYFYQKRKFIKLFIIVATFFGFVVMFVCRTAASAFCYSVCL